MKLMTYSSGSVCYFLLPLYKYCNDFIRDNFDVKFGTITFLLSVIVVFDGLEREFYHYIAYGLINLCTTWLVYKEIQKEREAEYQLYLGGGDYCREAEVEERKSGKIIDV